MSNAPSLNRYAYALQNPYRYWDPFGFCAAGVDEGCELGFLDILGAAAKSATSDKTYAELTDEAREANYQAHQTEGPGTVERINKGLKSGAAWVGEKVASVKESAGNLYHRVFDDTKVEKARQAVAEAADDVTADFDRTVDSTFAEMAGAGARGDTPEGASRELAIRKNAQGTGAAVRKGGEAAAAAAAVLYGGLKTVDDVGDARLVKGPAGKPISVAHDEAAHGGYFARKEARRLVATAKPAKYSKHTKATTVEEAIRLSERGKAQYLPGYRHVDLERKALAHGVVTRGDRLGNYHVLYRADEVVGYSNGQPTRWIRAEYAGGEFHGHPRTLEEVREFLPDAEE